MDFSQLERWYFLFLNWLFLNNVVYFYTVRTKYHRGILFKPFLIFNCSTIPMRSCSLKNIVLFTMQAPIKALFSVFCSNAFFHPNLTWVLMNHYNKLIMISIKIYQCFGYYFFYAIFLLLT